MKKINPKSTVNYDTKWTHVSLEAKDALFFKAKTPIQEIVPKLYQHLNSLKPSSQQDPHNFRMSNFSSLYRNVCRSYKGWQVFYRQPGKKTGYHSISEKIGYELSSRTPTSLKPILSRSMVWKHELDPVIKRVKLEGVESCRVIANRLNQQFSETFMNEILETGRPILKSLNQNYEQILEQEISLTVLDKSENWQKVLKTVSEFSDLIKTLNVSNNKTCKISTNNINNILTHRNKTAKGWQVEFLN